MWIHQHKIDDNHTDSFWYDGLIAETEDFELFATGEIKVSYEGETYNWYNALEIADKKGWGDKEIAENFEFIMNNWFEIIGKDTDAGDIADDYDQGLKYLVETQKEYDNEQR
jgi:hypothetical protein